MVRPNLPENICVKCKGSRLLCGKQSCPILLKHNILKSTLPFDPSTIKREQNVFGASPPAVFVGYHGYPQVNVGPLLPLGEFAEIKDTASLS